MSFLSLMNTTSRFCMSPADDNGSGGGGGGSDDANKQASMIDTDAIKKGSQDPNAGDGGDNKQVVNQDDPNKKPDDQKTVDQPGQKAARPDWLKEDKFWDAEKGEVKAEDILKSYKELEAKFHNGDHKAPAKAEDYKLKLDDDQKAVLFGKGDANPTDDPGIKALTGWAAKHKVSQDALNDLLGEYVDFVKPELEKVTIDIAAEKAVLGKNADAVIKNQMDFIGSLYRSGHINDKHLAELQILGETAAGIQALQAIRTYYGEQPIPTNLNTSGEGMPSKEELSGMLNDPKYDTDPDYRAKVDGLYAKRYGNQPAMSSAQNR